MKPYKDIGIIILAAGKGTRMESDLAKVLHKVAGKSMILHVVECASKITDKIHVVVGHQAEKVKDEISSLFDVNFAIQEQLLGTGDAVKAALPSIGAEIQDILVLCGDVPLIQQQTLEQVVGGHRNDQARVTVLATDVDDPTGYGRMVLDKDNNLLCIREEADANEQERKIKKINTGIYLFDTLFLKSAINELKPDNNQAEYYLTDVVSIAKAQNQKLTVVTMNDPRQVIGVNTLDELEKAERFIQ